MLRRIEPLALGLLVVALISGCAGWVGQERRESNTEVILVSYGSTNGELAPCG